MMERVGDSHPISWQIPRRLVRRRQRRFQLAPRKRDPFEYQTQVDGCLSHVDGIADSIGASFRQGKAADGMAVTRFHIGPMHRPPPPSLPFSRSPRPLPPSILKHRQRISETLGRLEPWLPPPPPHTVACYITSTRKILHPPPSLFLLLCLPLTLIVGSIWKSLQ